MRSPDLVVKMILAAALLAFIIDRVAYRTKERSGDQLPYDPNQAIRNSEPHDVRYRSPITWNALNPVIRAFSRNRNNSTQHHQQQSVLQKVSSWLNNAVSSLKKISWSSASVQTESQEKRALNEQVEKEAHDNSKAFHRTRINGIDIAYLNPFGIKKLRGIALLIHGCAQQAQDWFTLPEHRHIAAQLVRKRLALFAVTSRNQVTGCWSTRFPYWQNDDVERVVIATRQWMMDQSLPPTTPLHAVGISSGATMLSVLSASDLLPNLVSQALYISPGNVRAFRNATERYPNTLFVHVTNDQHYASPLAIAKARQILLRRKVALVGELPLPRVQLTPLTLHEREPRVSSEISQKIFAATEEEKGDMEKAMRSTKNEELMALWRDRDSRRALRQVIRVVNGFHEVSAVHADQVATWIVTNGHGAKGKSR